MRKISANWFSRKRDFSIIVFCAVPAETKLETENLIRTRLRWFCSNVEIMKKKGGSRGSRLLIWTKLVYLQTVSLASSAVFCGNEARNGFSGVGVGFRIASNLHMQVLDAVK